METTSPPNPTSPSAPERIRSTFLTVICILTFIGSSWGLIKAVRNYAAPDIVSAIAGEAVKNAEDKMDRQNTPGLVKWLMSSVSEMSPDNIRRYSIYGMASNLLTLTGALLMWSLRKTGFFVYMAGIIILIAGSIAVGGSLSAIRGSFIGIIGIIFIVMYGLNLKYMIK